MVLFNHLVLYQDKLTIQDSWQNRLVQKHFDTPNFVGMTYRNYGPSGLYINNQPVIKTAGQRVPFDCCGLTELAGFTQYLNVQGVKQAVSLLPFWEEYWPQFRLHLPIPMMFILARTRGGESTAPLQYVSPNNEIMAKNSIKISSFRNVRYPDHILDVHLMWHPDGTDVLTDVNSAWREPMVFPESFQP